VVEAASRPSLAAPGTPAWYTALLTGSRVKIGLRIGLKLLRAGATLIATSRFPLQTAQTYREMGREGEYERWVAEDRFHVFGVDLRDLASIEAMCAFVQLKFERLDCIVNNACQTIRRPAAYYKPAVGRERKIYEEQKETLLEGGPLRQFLTFEEQQRTKMEENRAEAIAAADPAPALESGDAAVPPPPPPSTSTSLAPPPSAASSIAADGVSRSAALTLVELLPEDGDSTALPEGLTDVNGQQLDLRRENSWLLKLDQVKTPEIVEAM
jgi:NAD(P)-dependent dehydrogenase (short-subunit alcohol dehydrogenase family)